VRLSKLRLMLRLSETGRECGQRKVHTPLKKDIELAIFRKTIIYQATMSMSWSWRLNSGISNASRFSSGSYREGRFWSYWTRLSYNSKCDSR